jgi:uncharacterized repeat protein (TIGR03803 family)
MNISRFHGAWRRQRGAPTLLALALTFFPAWLAQSARAQTFKVLYTFQGSTDGGTPESDLARDASGNLYGTTEYDFGSVFKLAPDGTLSVLHKFTGKQDGGQPSGGLVLDTAGNLYGATGEGGKGPNECCGLIFKLDSTGKESMLYEFTDGSDGATPYGDLVRDNKGNFYGTVYWMNGQSPGGVYKLDRNGEEKVLHAFTGIPDGATPMAGVVRDNKGNIFGTTSVGGGGACYPGCGTVFEVSNTGKETILYRFLASPDGSFPMAGLISGPGGRLYGTTYGGGVRSCRNFYGTGCGTVFEVGPSGRERVLYRFQKGQHEAGPLAGLVRDAQGNLYGTTIAGNGSVYKLDPQGSETVLYTFTGGSDGCGSMASLTLDPAGNLYGTASACGAYGYGTVFMIAP